MKTQQVAPLDAGWLWLESPSNLMHAGVLCRFTPPARARGDYVERLVQRMRKHTTPTPPFDRRLKRGRLERVAPQWELVGEVDLDYHLRVSEVAGEQGLQDLVSQLQSTELDKRHPLWTVDVITGLPDRGFAVLGRMHHALADGVAGVGIVSSWLSAEANDREMPPIWAYERTRRTGAAKEPTRRGGLPLLPLRLALSGAQAARFAVTGLSARPYSAPRSPLNAPITAERRIATACFELERFRALKEHTGGTINDVVLAVCAGALQRYLDELGALPDRPLITNMPVSVRRDGTHGNAISWAMLSLATDTDDVRERVATIRRATDKAKRRLSKLPSPAIDAYTLLTVSPILVEQLTRLGGRVPPLFNVPISNVPGPREPLFYDGARLDGLDAFTVIYGGQALNIVTLSYVDRLAFSFVGCSTALPGLDRLPEHTEAAIEELERAFAAP